MGANNLETAEYIHNLEDLVRARTAQLKQAVAAHEVLANLVREAAPALRTVSDDPAARKLVEMFGNNLAVQEIQAKLEPMHRLTAEVNRGASIPQVSAADVRQIWDATRQMNAEGRSPRLDIAIGLSVFAGYGVDCAAEPARFFAAQWRHMLLLDLIDRGVLSPWLHDGKPDDKVFEAAATMRCALEDLGRPTRKAIAQSEADLAAHASEGVAGAGLVTEETMDEATLAIEREAHRQSLIRQVELRTQQGKEAVAAYAKLMHLVGDAVPALRKANVDDPAVKKLLEQFAWIDQ